MEIADFVAAVFAGNVLTLCFAWGLREFSKYEDAVDAPWLAYAAVLMPLVGFILAMVANSGPPPYLDALAAQ